MVNDLSSLFLQAVNEKEIFIVSSNFMNCSMLLFIVWCTNTDPIKEGGRKEACCFLPYPYWPCHQFLKINNLMKNIDDSGADPETWKGGALYIGHHDWPTKKILGFRWSKKAKITLQTKAFGEIFLSVFSNFLHFYT